MRNVDVDRLILDYNLYPRGSVDSQHVSYMVESLKVGIELPPIVVDKNSMRVVDGFHRVAAIRRFHDPDDKSIKKKKVRAIFKVYEDEGEIFLDAMRYNSAHGRMLTQYDRVHCIIKAEELKLDIDVVADALRVSVDKLGELRVTRMGEFHVAKPSKRKRRKGTFNGKAIPLKRTIDHKAGSNLTSSQVEANEKLSGMEQAFYANQLILLLENDLLNEGNDYLIQRLEVLHRLLGDLFSGKKKKVSAG